MKAKLLEGKILAAEIKERLLKEIIVFKENRLKDITLIAVQVGENPSSEIYIKSQKKNAEALGINYRLLKLDATVGEKELLSLIDGINKDESMHGVIIQMPLPPGFNRQRIIEAVSVSKDIEGIHPENLGSILLGKPRFIPCTAQAAYELVKSTGINLYGKEVVIVGHSEIVGKPLSLLFLNDFSTVTVCH
ncbi:MAG: bifunctional 5,10-methylenetetrahydrofolate dehydrogenase/5,10-methenyltetrahydrofolate cyclohydrolase, partial [Candidatus Omnitrophica bacterium]|nr:bifunctional 5,10-methylenetetrahydrofolate dehydrogenase/5,10-methenyltetrahydrofolate cyclohydrolase [Candidatus Omnitrophota bacterium]